MREGERSTRGNVAIGASNGGHGFCFVGVLKEFGKPEVRNVRVECGVQENVVGLDISVHYQRRTVVMQVTQPVCSLDCYVVPADRHQNV